MRVRDRGGSVRRAAAALLIAALPLQSCGDGDSARGTGGEATRTDAGDVQARLAAWEREHPDRPVQAAVLLDTLRSDADVTRLLQRHGVVPYAARVRVAGLVTWHRIPPDDASLRFLDGLRNQVGNGIETALCAQIGRAAAMLRTGRVSAASGRGVLATVERSREAVERLRDATLPYMEAVQVAGTVRRVRSLAADTAVARVEPGSVVDGRVVVPDVAAARETDPAVPEHLAALGPDSVLERLRAVASEGLPGCEPAPPPAALEGG